MTWPQQEPPTLASFGQLPSPSEYGGPLRRDVRRGIQVVTFKVPGNRPAEICVIPRHLPFGDYRGKDGAKDRDDERKLASYDFYQAGTARSGAVGISPKRTSTSAAVKIYQLPDGASRPAYLSPQWCRSIENQGKQVAKFKQTDNRFTTTSTASILGYYHVSRALGDIGEIKPAVLRTMDIPQHQKVVRLAFQMGARGTVAKSWALFDHYYANPKGSAVARDLFTSDFTQIYGALLENTRGEDGYTEWLQAGTNLSTTRAFRHMADPRPARHILGSNSFTKYNVQSLVAMRDMSELILLDYLLGQSDRLSGGNISSYDYAYDLLPGKVKSAKASKAPDPKSGTARVIVKKLTIKDTDGGLLNPSTFERKGYLGRIRHMHPRTYNALLRFAHEWETDPSVPAFFHQECTFSTRQLARFGKHLRTAAATLHARRENGSLHLDLDLDDFFREVEPYPTDDVRQKLPKRSLIVSAASDRKPPRSDPGETPEASSRTQSPTPRPKVVKISLADLPKGVTPYPTDNGLSDLEKLGLIRRGHGNGKPRHGAAGAAHAMNTEGPSSTREAGLAQPDPTLPKGVQRYPANQALPHGVAVDSPAKSPARQPSPPQDALAQLDLEAAN